MAPRTNPILDRTLPHNVEAERATLGAILLNQDAIPKVWGILGDNTEAFYVQVHSIIYGAILALVDKDNPVDEITVTDQLKTQGMLNMVGGAAYIAELTLAVATSANAEIYAQLVLNYYRSRQNIIKADRYLKASWALNPEELRKFRADLDLEETYQLKEIVVSDIINAPDPPPPLWTRGPSPHTYGVVAGEGDTSKSYWMLSMAVALTTGHVTLPAFTPTAMSAVVYLAYEDNPATIKFRLQAIANAGGFPFKDVELAVKEKRLTFICQSDGPLFRNMPKEGTTTTALFDALTNIVRDRKPDLTIIDPLSGAARLRSENDNSEMATIAETLADFATRHHTTVLLVHHAAKAGGIRGATALRDRARWAVLLERFDGDDSNDIVIKVNKDNLHGCHDSVVLSRGEDGVPIQSDKIAKPGEKHGGEGWNIELRNAVKETETEKGVLLTVPVLYEGQKDDIPTRLWFSKKGVKYDKIGNRWLIARWQLDKKTSDELGGGKILVRTYDAPHPQKEPETPKSSPDETDEQYEEEELF